MIRIWNDQGRVESCLLKHRPYLQNDFYKEHRVFLKCSDRTWRPLPLPSRLLVSALLRQVCKHPSCSFSYPRNVRWFLGMNWAAPLARQHPYLMGWALPGKLLEHLTGSHPPSDVAYFYIWLNFRFRKNISPSTTVRIHPLHMRILC